MENNMEMLLIMAACILVLFIGAIRRKAEWLLNFVMRSILGIIGIYFINMILEGIGIVPTVGINPMTVLTSGMLGFPGVAALYGIGMCKVL